MRLLLVFIFSLVFTSVFADTRAQAYQDGVKTAQKAKADQQNWEEGKGNPKMVKAYKEGKEAAEQAIQQRRLTSS